MAALKSPPFLKIDRASATAAYEQDDDAAPSALAKKIVLGLSSGSRRLISALADDGLNHGRQDKTEDECPKYVPTHGKAERQGVDGCMKHGFKLALPPWEGQGGASSA